MSSTTVTDAREGLRARLSGADGMPDWELVDVLAAAVAERREVDLLIAEAAAQISVRSPAGPDGMARRWGFSGVDQFIASVTGGTVAEAERLRVVGSALAGDEDDALGGASVLPHLAAAVRERRLSPDAFVLVRGVLVLHPEARDAAGLAVDDALRATPLARVPLARVERMTVDKAQSGTLRTVRSLVRQIEAGLTPPAVAEERHEELRQLRTASIREESNGMIRLTALLDPMTAAPLLAAVDGYVKHAYRAAVDHDSVDSRTPGQLRADALGWLGRHANGCRRPHDAVKTTVVVRMSLEDLQAGEGYGTVDGLRTPLPVSVLRRNAADAEVIPTVLGTRGEILDQGKTSRLFTLGQRRAIAERDRGCAMCGLPPAYCDTHHIIEWQHGGSSDVANGIMLCVRHHHMIHREHWRIRWRNGLPLFIPPASIDPGQTPIPGYQDSITLEVVGEPHGASPGGGARCA